jgi:hypothetical protein
MSGELLVAKSRCYDLWNDRCILRFTVYGSRLTELGQ